MRLRDTFFTQVSFLAADGKIDASVRLPAGGSLFGAHFPGFPITPGAVLLRIATELLEDSLGKPLSLVRADRVKFVAPLLPDEVATYSFSYIYKEDDLLSVRLVIRVGTEIRSRMELSYRSGVLPFPRICKNLKLCAIIPVYENAGTVRDVVERTLVFCPDVIVIDDGSTDGSSASLEGLGVRLVRSGRNRGKGHALKTGFRTARSMGFECALTLDADGQHIPEDIPAFLEAARLHPGAMLVGSRNLRMENMPKGNTFANRFSNFWFHLQTGVRLPDTQSGFRLYPLGRLGKLRFLTSRYEAELELLVTLAWKGVEMIPVCIRVHYPPEGERVTHFRPFRDFVRISLLNTLLCLLALCCSLPARMRRRQRAPALPCR